MLNNQVGQTKTLYRCKDIFPPKKWKYARE